MKRVFVLLLVTILALPTVVQSQVFLNKVLSENAFSTYNDEKLLLVEFWATWCIPCLAASKHLEVKQEMFKDNLHVISVSKESEEQINKYIVKHQPKLAIANDFESKTFDFYSIDKFLPYAVLIDKNNKVVWKGNPINLSDQQISILIKNNNAQKYQGNKRVSFYEYKKNSLDNQEVFTIQNSISKEEQYQKDDFTFIFNGKLSNLLMDFLDLSSFQFDIKKDVDVEAKISNKYLLLPRNEKLALIKNAYNIDWNVIESYGPFSKIEISNVEMLWDTSQIKWGSTSNNYLYGEQNLTINNASVTSLARHLTDIFDELIIFDSDDGQLYDWQFSYKVRELLLMELENSFGIILEPITYNYPVYSFSIQ